MSHPPIGKQLPTFILYEGAKVSLRPGKHLSEHIEGEGLAALSASAAMFSAPALLLFLADVFNRLWAHLYYFF